MVRVELPGRRMEKDGRGEARKSQKMRGMWMGPESDGDGKNRKALIWLRIRSDVTWNVRQGYWDEMVWDIEDGCSGGMEREERM